MSVDQLASSSFGDPNAQPPPTPPNQKTPTTTSLPSPVFETPKQGQGHFDDAAAGCWTPRFAEEYSIFNATPGNLRASPRAGTFGDFGTPFTPTFPPGHQQQQQQPQHTSPAAGAQSNKRRLSAEGIAEEIATHATHFSPNSNLPLPPVEPSRRLPSSPGAFTLTHDQAAAQEQERAQAQTKAQKARDSELQATPAKKVRRGGAAQDGATGQTATPPPSASKGTRRRLAPKVDADDTMQNDHGFGDFPGSSAGNTNQQHQQHQQQHQQHSNMGVFVTSPGDMFGFTMSAPASAALFVDSRSFWETNAGAIAGIEIDFSAAGADVFQNPTAAADGTHHRPAGSLDWGRADQMFQETGMLPHHQQQQQQQQQQQHQQRPLHEHQSQQGRHRQEDRPPPVKRERPLAPKTMMPNLDTSNVMDQSMLVDSTIYQTPVEDPFGMVHPGGGVDPGLLFSRPPSSSMEAVFNPMQQQHQLPSSSGPTVLHQSATLHQQLQHNENLDQSHIQNQSMAIGSAQGLGISKAPMMRAELRRSMGGKELSPSKQSSKVAAGPALAGSPVKSAGRPGLSRSFSENRGRRQAGRLSGSSSTSSASLPVLAPAIKPAPLPQQQAQPGCNSTSGMSRPSSHGSTRSSGRLSPLKAHHHHRLSSLTSIPEAGAGTSAMAAAGAAFGKRTSVKFTIDANGRARVETVVAEEEVGGSGSGGGGGSLMRRRRGTRHPTRGGSARWGDSTDDDGGPGSGFGDDEDDDDASSTDDEPIIIPSRNTSFTFPDPLKASGSRGGGGARYHSHSHRASQRSLSEHSATSGGALVLPGETLFGGSGGSSSNDPESEAETVVNDGGLLASGAGDAASELEKLRQGRQHQQQQGRQRPGNGLRLKVPGSGGAHRQRFTPSSAGGAGGSGGARPQHHQYSSAATSPTMLTDASLPTPSTGSRTGRGIRCVCDPADHVRDGFMVQCESCEMWLHGRCINISKRSMMPSVYICAFCARTSHGRAGRASIPASASSPLAHKSFTKFR